MEEKINNKAKEIYFSYINVGRGLTSDFLAKESAKVCVDKILNAISGDKELDAFYRAVRIKIDSLS